MAAKAATHETAMLVPKVLAAPSKEIGGLMGDTGETLLEAMSATEKIKERA